MSVLSFPQRGPWGDAKWPCNCSGYIYKSLFEQLRPVVFIDPMMGSGTSIEVAQEMGIKAIGLDLHSGFNVLRDSILLQESPLTYVSPTRPRCLWNVSTVFLKFFLRRIAQILQPWGTLVFSTSNGSRCSKFPDTL